MYKNHKLAIIIPALNEEEALPLVIKDIPDFVDTVMVIDNCSSDNTAEVARENNVRVYREDRKGYGWACLKGMANLVDEDIVVFLDGDYSDYPDKLAILLDPIIDDHNDMVISNRFTHELEKGAMTFPQIFGNKLAVFLIKLLWGYCYHDLGPFRTITREALKRLNLRDKNYGWTIEMQIKALQHQLKIAQVNVPYRRRTMGKSKVSSTIKGVFMAGYKIIGLIIYYKFSNVFPAK